METRALSTSRAVIRKPTTLIDAQNAFDTVTLSVSENQSLTYFFVADGPMKRSITIDLARQSTVNVFGIIMGNSDDTVRCNLVISHREPMATSFVSLKGVFTDSASGKINGTIRILADGNQANARLEERVLLLTPGSSAETIPNLEIEAHDVIASHAATVSKLSDNEIFYVQSRGIPYNTAKKLIIRSFLLSSLGHLPEGDVRAKLEKLLRKKIEAMSV